MSRVGDTKVCARVGCENEFVKVAGRHEFCRDKECIKARERAHNQTLEHKAHQRAYDQTPKRKAYHKALRRTPKAIAYHKAYRQENKTYWNAYQQTPSVKAYQKESRLDKRTSAMRAVSDAKCEECGITDMDMIVIHHRKRPGDVLSKDTGTSDKLYRYILAHPERADNFMVLCRNHHAKLHADQRNGCNESIGGDDIDTIS